MSVNSSAMSTVDDSSEFAEMTPAPPSPAVRRVALPDDVVSMYALPVRASSELGSTNVAMGICAMARVSPLSKIAVTMPSSEIETPV